MGRGKVIHGHCVGDGRRSPTLQCWANMIRRCTQPSSQRYYVYGARGIGVDPRWLDFTKFLEDMGCKPEGYTLDRIDNNKGYSRANCRWACRFGQRHNRRDTKLSWEKVTEIKRLRTEGFGPTDLAEQFGVCRSTIKRIINGKIWRQELPAIYPTNKENN